jgi:hypothetical protein
MKSVHGFASRRDAEPDSDRRQDEDRAGFVTVKPQAIGFRLLQWELDDVGLSHGIDPTPQND